VSLGTYVLADQCRMNEHIAYFPSETLYDNLLMSDASVAKRTLLSLPSMSDQNSEEAKETLEPTVVFFDTAGCEFFERSESDSDGDAKLVKGVLGEGSKSNENEAVVVAKWARKLVCSLECLPNSAEWRLDVGLARCTCGWGGGGHALSGSGVPHLVDVARGIPGDDDWECGWSPGAGAGGKTASPFLSTAC